MFMIPNIPVWDTIEIDTIFWYLWQLFVKLWVWSGQSGIRFNGTFYSYRNIIVAGMVVALVIRGFAPLLGYEQDYDETVSEFEHRF